MSPTIEFRGTYGTFKVDALSGLVVEQSPDWDEINAEGGPGYTDIIKVDLAERRAWYAARGVELPEIQPDGDILDVGFWDQDLTYCRAENDWREEIMLARYHGECAA